MNSALRVLQGLLALAFLMTGSMKVLQPRERLGANMAWTEDFSAGQMKAIGILEALGAMGLILPAVTGILPWLSPLAGAGLALTMTAAALTHLRRGETPMIGVNLVLLALAAFVAYGRFMLVPVA